MSDPIRPLRIDSATLRQIAVYASVDPRTVRAVADGKTVRGLPDQRVRAALRKFGYEPPPRGDR